MHTARETNMVNQVVADRLRFPVLMAVLSLVLAVAPVLGRGDRSMAGAATTTCSARVLELARASTSVAAPTTASATDRAIADAERLIKRNPKDASATKSLAAALLQKVREEADPSFYARVEGALASLGGARSTDPEVLLLEGTLLLARHDFAQALDVGKRAAAALPGNASAYGILVDAYNELGRYDDALAATQMMVDARPGLASFARVSYARELRGDTFGAMQAMQQAAISSQGIGENAAYVSTLLGNLFLSNGNFPDASASYTAALRAFPGFGAARAGQAALLSACGHPEDAARLIGEVIDQQPVLQYAMAKADYLTAAGKRVEAKAATQLVDAIALLQRVNGVDIDLEMAVYEANQRPTVQLVSSTRRALAKRPSVAGHDAMAWVLYRTGHHREAAKEMAVVTGLGDRDPVFRFHAAVIALADGQTASAKQNFAIVLAGNPRAAGIDQTELATLARQLRM